MIWRETRKHSAHFNGFEYATLVPIFFFSFYGVKLQRDARQRPCVTDLCTKCIHLHFLMRHYATNFFTIFSSYPAHRLNAQLFSAAFPLSLFSYRAVPQKSQMTPKDRQDVTLTCIMAGGGGGWGSGEKKERERNK